MEGPRMTADAGRMHQFNPEMTDLILEFVRDRLSLEETPVDGLGVRSELHEALDGLMTDAGRPAAEVLGLYVDHIADTILSADSPRFWAFIPAAPTKAALLFDMVVSAASLQGCSWLEAAGAVAAENQALRVMMDAAGLPQSAGGVFVSGGSAGNLSALVVARDTARRARQARERTGASQPGRRSRAQLAAPCECGFTAQSRPQIGCGPIGIMRHTKRHGS